MEDGFYREEIRTRIFLRYEKIAGYPGGQAYGEDEEVMELAEAKNILVGNGYVLTEGVSISGIIRNELGIVPEEYFTYEHNSVSYYSYDMLGGICDIDKFDDALRDKGYYVCFADGRNIGITGLHMLNGNYARLSPIYYHGTSVGPETIMSNGLRCSSRGAGGMWMYRDSRLYMFAVGTMMRREGGMADIGRITDDIMDSLRNKQHVYRITLPADFPVYMDRMVDSKKLAAVYTVRDIPPEYIEIVR